MAKRDQAPDESRQYFDGRGVSSMDGNELFIVVVDKDKSLRDNRPTINKSDVASIGAGQKSKRQLNCLLKFPYFILLVTFLEVCFHFLAGDGLKRALLYDPDNAGQIWRFLTYVLVHNDIVHLFLNLGVQGFVGTALEIEQGSQKCGAVYVASGLAGSLGSAAFSPRTLLAGASAAIYGLLTSHVPNIALNYTEMKYVCYRSAALITLIAFDIIHVVHHVWVFNNEDPVIGWKAHASGAIAGLNFGFLIFMGSSKWRRQMRIGAGFAIAISLATLAVYYGLSST